MSEISEVVAGQVNERFLEVPTNATYFADLAILTGFEPSSQNPFDVVIRNSLNSVQASNSIWVPAASFGSSGSSQSLSWTGDSIAQSAWLFADEVTSAIATSLILPEHWSTFNVDIYWSNAGNGSGNVNWYVDSRLAGNGDSFNATDSGGIYSASVAAPVKSILKVTRALTERNNNPSKVFFIRSARIGGVDGVNDTLTNDAAFIGFRLTRAS